MPRDRGSGGLFKYKHSKNWYAQVYRNGKPCRVSTGTAIKQEAQAKLQKMLFDADQGKPFVSTRTVKYEQLREGLISSYVEKGNKSLLVDTEGNEFINGLNALDEYFKDTPFSRITTDATREFVKRRLAEGVTHSTVNNSLSLLRRMLKIAYEDGKIPFMPVVRLLKPNPARKGFLSHEQFNKLIGNLPEYLRRLITFLFWCGCRLGEAKQITWNQVDLKNCVIRLEDEQTKSGEARIVPLPNVVVESLAAVQDKTGNVFDTTNLRKEWAKACVAAGLGTLGPIDKNGNRRYDGLIIHDLRRSAVRNLRKAGVAESVAMKISGHKTRDVFERYNIVDEEDLLTAMKRAEAAAATVSENLMSVSESSVRVDPVRSPRKKLTP